MEPESQSSQAPETATPTLPIRKTAARDWFETVMFGLSLLMFFNGYVFQNFQIPTSSMENSLLIGDHLTANKFMFANYQWDWEKKILPIRDLKRGDVVVFKYPGNVRDDYIKRCIGLPGERFKIVKGQLYINDEPINEPYTYFKDPSVRGDRDPSIKFRPKGYFTDKPGLKNAKYVSTRTFTTQMTVAQTARNLNEFFPRKTEEKQQYMNALFSAEDGVIPEGFYLMMGDNRNRSNDSRSWGLVPRSLVEGRAYIVWWSYAEDENSHTLRGMDLLVSYLRVPFTFWTRTHWSECFRLIK